MKIGKMSEFQVCHNIFLTLSPRGDNYYTHIEYQEDTHDFEVCCIQMLKSWAPIISVVIVFLRLVS